MLREKIRWSCGAGLVFLLGIARVELNYCVPFGAQNSDRYQFVNLATSVVYIFISYIMFIVETISFRTANNIHGKSALVRTKCVVT